MLTHKDRKVLETIVKHNLIKRSELLKLTGTEFNGIVDDSLKLLKDNGFIESISPIGETSFIATRKGIQAIK